MPGFGRSLAAGLAIVVVAGCTKSEKPPADTAAAAAASTTSPGSATDDSTVRDLNATWFRVFNAHDAGALAALYADDAVLMVPGSPAARGREAIKAAYQKDMDAMAKSGYLNNQGNDSESAVSGDLAYESNTFNVTDKTGKKIEAGKYVTVFAKRNGKWMIIRDIWNSDTMPATP